MPQQTSDLKSLIQSHRFEPNHDADNVADFFSSALRSVATAKPQQRDSVISEVALALQCQRSDLAFLYQPMRDDSELHFPDYRPMLIAAE